MNTEDKPVAFLHGDALMGGVAVMVGLLKSIAGAVAQRTRPFREVCATNTRCGSQLTSGVLRCAHNPTTADVLLQLADGTNGSVMVYNGPLAPGESRALHIAFYDGLYCVQGNGIILGGDFNA